MFHTLTEYYVNRNVKIIREFLALTNGGNNTREATAKVSELLTTSDENVSKGTVHAVIFDKKYSHAAEAWAIIHKEEEEKEKEKGTNGATKAIAGEVATA